MQENQRKRTSVTHAHASNASTHFFQRMHNNAHANALTQTQRTHQRITQTRNPPCPWNGLATGREDTEKDWTFAEVDLETDFVYRHSTARRLISAIEEVRAGQYVSEGVRREEKMRQMLEKYRAEMLGSKVILLTGSTGSSDVSSQRDRPRIQKSNTSYALTGAGDERDRRRR